MSGNPRAFNDMLDCMYHGGKIAMLGIMPKGAGADWDKVIFKGLTLYGVTGRKMYSTWHQMVRFLRAGQLDPRPVLTHRFPLEGIAEAIAIIKEGKAGKVILEVANPAEWGGA